MATAAPAEWPMLKPGGFQERLDGACHARQARRFRCAIGKAMAGKIGHQKLKLLRQ
jgi:hypothetical protein